MLLTVSCLRSDGRPFLRALPIRPAIPGSGLEMGVLERHLIRASSARTAGPHHHQRRPLWRWSCWGAQQAQALLHGPGPAAGSSGQGQAASRHRRWSQSNPEVRSARAACRHRPEAGPAALASSRSPPSPDRMGGSTPRCRWQPREGFANQCGRSRPRVSRCQETLADPDASRGIPSGLT
jgi:hypothetical protein